MFLMIVDGMLSAPDQTGLLNRSLGGCQYTKQRGRAAGDGEVALCAAQGGVRRRADDVPQDCHEPTCWDGAVDKNGLVEGTG